MECPVRRRLASAPPSFSAHKLGQSHRCPLPFTLKVMNKPFLFSTVSTVRSCSMLLAACLCMASPAHALDSLHLACVGKVDLGQGPRKFALTYDRSGYSDSVDDADIHKVVLRNDDNKNDVLFRGTVLLVDNGENLLVDGDFFDDDKKPHHLHTKLEGYEVAGIWYGKNIITPSSSHAKR